MPKTSTLTEAEDKAINDSLSLIAGFARTMPLDEAHRFIYGISLIADSQDNQASALLSEWSSNLGEALNSLSQTALPA